MAWKQVFTLKVLMDIIQPYSMSSTILLKGLDNKYIILKHTSCWWTDQSFKQPKRDSWMTCPSSEFMRYLVISAAWQDFVHQNLSIKTGSVDGGYSFYQRSSWLQMKLRKKNLAKTNDNCCLCSISGMYPDLWYQYRSFLKAILIWSTWWPDRPNTDPSSNLKKGVTKFPQQWLI